MHMVTTLEDAILAIESQELDIFEMEEMELHHNIGEDAIVETYDTTKQYPHNFSNVKNYR